MLALELEKRVKLYVSNILTRERSDQAKIVDAVMKGVLKRV